MSYLVFISRPSVSGKTQVISIASARSGELLARISWFGRWRCYAGELLARISWFGRWRCYAFYPEPNTIWNIDCLDEVRARLASLKEK